MIAIMRINLRMVATLLLLAAFVSCRQAGPATNVPGTDLQTFLDNADSTLLRLGNEASQDNNWHAVKLLLFANPAQKMNAACVRQH